MLVVRVRWRHHADKASLINSLRVVATPRSKRTEKQILSASKTLATSTTDRQHVVDRSNHPHVPDNESETLVTTTHPSDRPEASSRGYEICILHQKTNTISIPTCGSESRNQSGIADSLYATPSRQRGVSRLTPQNFVFALALRRRQVVRADQESCLCGLPACIMMSFNKVTEIFPLLRGLATT